MLYHPKKGARAAAPFASMPRLSFPSKPSNNSVFDGRCLQLQQAAKGTGAACCAFMGTTNALNEQNRYIYVCIGCSIIAECLSNANQCAQTLRSWKRKLLNKIWSVFCTGAAVSRYRYFIAGAGCQVELR